MVAKRRLAREPLAGLRVKGTAAFLPHPSTGAGHPDGTPEHRCDRGGVGGGPDGGVQRRAADGRAAAPASAPGKGRATSRVQRQTGRCPREEAKGANRLKGTLRSEEHTSEL